MQCQTPKIVVLPKEPVIKETLPKIVWYIMSDGDGYYIFNCLFSRWVAVDPQ